jgi:CheY-like chemotaxis protein/DNA-binding XRE family transcriptional regulator
LYRVVKKTHVPKDDQDLQTRLGMAVREYRQLLGITQEELAWRSDLHRTYIADIERGARNITLRSVENLAKALQITVGHLISTATAKSAPAAPIGDSSEPSVEKDILLIEDNPTDAVMAARAFTHAKIANPLKLFREAEQALEYLYGTGRYAQQKPRRPQLILLDLNLPQMSGLEFLQRIKGDERMRTIPIVVLTVSQSDRMIIECGLLGAENYIVKPVSVENLVRVTPKLNLHLTVGPP